MYKIYKLTSNSAIDYAAEELKKYMRMMMPDCGEIEITLSPDATEGFRLALMSDFLLDTSDVKDTAIDDIIYIDTDKNGGIIAGDNPRSVLIAVYEFLRRQGCRWFFPGVDGEYIPVIDEVTPVKLRHVPSLRIRGWCNEGGEVQYNMYEAIEFAPKVGLNTFMIEFRIPTPYYRRYYNHMHNEKNRPPEPVSDTTVLQWKRACEAEIAKRGLIFHDMGHGFTVDSFGIDSCLDVYSGNNDEKIPPESREFVALVNGERKLNANVPNFTQFCMSNVRAREKFVDYVSNYAEKSSHVNFLHVWLADGINCHCECDECKKKNPSDWYMILLNELDAELTRRCLNTKIVFCGYSDTLWAPIEEKLDHPERFSMLFGPSSRRYTEPVTGDTKGALTVPYVRNNITLPDSPEEVFAYLDDWRRVYHGMVLSYEYHFFWHHVYEVSNIKIAHVINDDVRGYIKTNIEGIIEDGSQRAFFPTGLHFYTYARTSFDATLTADELAEDYFSHAFGKDWKKFYDYLLRLGDAIDWDYLEGQNSADKAKCTYYNPGLAESFASAKDIIEEGRALIREHYNSDSRFSTASVRLLEFHAKFCELLAEALWHKCQGHDEIADRLEKEIEEKCGVFEAHFERNYDQGHIFQGLDVVFVPRTKCSNG